MSREDSRREPRAMGQFSGGQPPRRKHVTVNVPVGVERALILAAGDPIFRQELLRGRDGAVLARGMTLRESEAALLRAAPAAQLEAFVESLDVSPANVKRRAFMGAVAASAAALAAGGTLGCGEEDVKTDARGINADAGMDAMPLDVSTYNPDMGILPDTQPLDVPVFYPDAGVPVDVPLPEDKSAGVDISVPLDVPPYKPDMGILPDTNND